MNGLAEVIPIATYRARKKPGTPPSQASEPVVSAQTRRRRLIGFLGVLTGAVLALIVVDRTFLSHQASAQPPLTSEMRQGLYQRALDDVAAACTTPQARIGLLRQHCAEQARFLQQLPECTADCAKLTEALLTRR